MQYDKDRPAHPELLQREHHKEPLIWPKSWLERAMRYLYEWTQDMSLRIRIPASTAYAKEEYSEMAAKIASYYHRQKGHVLCVRFYYGSGKVIANE